MWSKTLQRPIPFTRSGIPAWRTNQGEKKNMRRKAKHNRTADYPDVLRVGDVGEIFHLSDRMAKPPKPGSGNNGPEM
jgi:hypothetical protein